MPSLTVYGLFFFWYVWQENPALCVQQTKPDYSANPLPGLQHIKFGLINLKGKTKFKRGNSYLSFEKVIGSILKKPRNRKCVKSFESMSTAISITRI